MSTTGSMESQVRPLAVSMETKSPDAYFNVLAPGTEWAFHNGSMSGNSMKRRLPMGGKVTVRVYLNSAAGRIGKSATFNVKISVLGKAYTPVPKSKDAVLPGTMFHASGEIAAQGTSPGSYKAYVVRWTGGAATVEMRLPQNRKLQLLFADGALAGWSSAEKPKASRKGDVTQISVEGMSFSVPDAFLYGG